MLLPKSKWPKEVASLELLQHSTVNIPAQSHWMRTGSHLQISHKWPLSLLGEIILEPPRWWLDLCVAKMNSFYEIMSVTGSRCRWIREILHTNASAWSGSWMNCKRLCQVFIFSTPTGTIEKKVQNNGCVFFNVFLWLFSFLSWGAFRR
jgi:hypothetical protein